MATTPSPTSDPAHDLGSIAEAYWDWQLEESPMSCTYLGLRRGLDRLDEQGPAARARREKALNDFLLGVEAVAPDALSAEERITRAILLRELSESLESYRHHGWESELNQLMGLHIAVQDLVGVHPISEPKDADALAARFDAVPKAFEEHIDDLRAGLASGRVAPGTSYDRVLAQAKAFLATPDAASAFLLPISRLPASWPDAERSRVAARLADAFRKSVKPAYASLVKFLETDYAGKARSEPGVWSIPGGTEAYAFAARSQTTTTLSPDRIHQIGQEELAKNEREMLDIARQEGHTGDLRSFLDTIARDARFRLATRDEVIDRYRAICARMDGRLAEAFGRLPKTRYEVKPLEAYREKDAPAAYYLPPAIDGSRPGTFYANTHDPSSWPTYDMEALCFHEAVPGHHLQIALAQELDGLPTIRRHGRFTAYVEGWAHYTERLADEMGAYSTNYDRLGMLAAQAWRAARLVVDTGMHHLKWKRDQALAVMNRIRSGNASDVGNEIDRYIIWPGQALAYKVGQRTIAEVRERAKRRLGARFTLAGFHDEVLRHGALPLSILEDVVRSWEPSPA